MATEQAKQSRFHILVDQYQTLHESGRGGTDHALDLLAEALSLAPPEIKRQVAAKITELWGPMPTAGYCDDNGTPCYAVPQIEKWLGRKIGLDEMSTPLGKVYRLN